MARHDSASKLYNYVQLGGWGLILICILLKLAQGSWYVYQSIEYVLKPIQLLQFIEALFALTGVTRSNFAHTLGQTFFRNFMIFCVFEKNPSEYWILGILLCWSVGGIVRYSRIL